MAEETATTTADAIDDVEQLEPGAAAAEPGTTIAPAKPDSTDDLKAAMAELAKNVSAISRPKVEDEPPMSDEDKAKLWAIYNPEESRKDFFKKFFRMNPEATEEEVKEAKELFSEMQKGFVKQAVVGSRNILKIELDKLREEFAPLREHISSVRAKETRERFAKAFPVLNDPKFEKVVSATARTLTDRNFDSEEAYFKVLAESTAEAIKGIVPDFDLGKQPEKPKPGSTPRLPRTSVGGTGGAGSGTRPDSSKSPNDIDSIEM